MSFDLLKAVPIIHVTLSNMKKAVLHDGWSLSSPNYHHTDQYLTVNIDVLACMVSTSYLVQICRYAEMQICRYAPISQDQKWHTQNLNSTAQRFERSQTQKKHKNTKEHKNSNRVGCPNKLSFLSNVASNFISPCFPHFFPFSNAFPSDLQSTKNAFPFRPQVSSQLSNQTAAVNSTRAQSSSSTQQPRDRYTALLSFECCPEMPSAPTAPTAVLPPWQQTCSTCPAPGRSCSVLNHPYLVLPGDTQCSHSSHSSAPTAPTAVLPQLPQLPQLP